MDQMKRCLTSVFLAITTFVAVGCNAPASVSEKRPPSPNFPEFIFEEPAPSLCMIRYHLSYEHVNDKMRAYITIVDRFAASIHDEGTKLFDVDFFEGRYFSIFTNKPDSGCGQAVATFNALMLDAVRGAALLPQEAPSPKDGNYTVPVLRWKQKFISIQNTNGKVVVWNREKFKKDWPGNFIYDAKYRAACGVTITPKDNPEENINWFNRVIGYHSTRVSFSITYITRSDEGTELTLLFAGKCDNLEARTEAIIRWVSQVSGTEPPGPYTIERAG
jgi:hypothetical protein